MLKTSFTSLLFIIFLSSALAQEDDPVISPPDTLSQVNADTTKVETEKIGLLKKFKDKTYPNPIRAAGLSLVLPGSGQAYNKKIWKIPVIYAGLGSMGYFIYDNNKNYKKFKEAYLIKIDDDPLTIDKFPTASENTLLSIRNRYDKRRQQSYVGFVAIWVLNSVDAFVDAHLQSFDVNEDLSLSIHPVLTPFPNGLEAQVGLSIQSKIPKPVFNKFF